MSAAAQAHYGRWARLYDVVATRTPLVGGWRERAADALSLSPGDTVVEMGCGTGANLPYLRERVGAEGRVVGVDFTRPVLDRARERVARRGWRNVDLVRGDAAAPPVGDADAVLASFVVGMLDDPAAAVEGWCDLVGPGGRVGLLDAARSGRPAARPLDALLRGVVVLSRPPTFRVRYDDDPHGSLARRVADAHGALRRRSPAAVREEFLLGVVRLTAGRVA